MCARLTNCFPFFLLLLFPFFNCPIHIRRRLFDGSLHVRVEEGAKKKKNRFQEEVSSLLFFFLCLSSVWRYTDPCTAAAAAAAESILKQTLRQ